MVGRTHGTGETPAAMDDLLDTYETALNRASKNARQQSMDDGA